VRAGDAEYRAAEAMNLHALVVNLDRRHVGQSGVTRCQLSGLPVSELIEGVGYPFDNGLLQARGGHRAIDAHLHAHIAQGDFRPERPGGDFLATVVSVRHILRRGVTVRPATRLIASSPE
jgi:hypothetical protein